MNIGVDSYCSRSINEISSCYKQKYRPGTDAGSEPEPWDGFSALPLQTENEVVQYLKPNMGHCGPRATSDQSGPRATSDQSGPRATSGQSGSPNNYFNYDVIQ